MRACFQQFARQRASKVRFGNSGSSGGTGVGSTSTSTSTGRTTSTPFGSSTSSTSTSSSARRTAYPNSNTFYTSTTNRTMATRCLVVNALDTLVSVSSSPNSTSSGLGICYLEDDEDDGT